MQGISRIKLSSGVNMSFINRGRILFNAVPQARQSSCSWRLIGKRQLSRLYRRRLRVEKRPLSNPRDTDRLYQAALVCNSKDYDSKCFFFLLSLSGVGIASLLTCNQNVDCRESEDYDEGKCPLGFLYYRRSEVAKHKSKDTGIWVTYKDGVYDITDFVDSHPGGERILLAAGGAIDPFWAMYNQHMTKQVIGILAQHRIGTLHPREEIEVVDFDDPYANDPPRLAVLPVRNLKPFNAETIAELIPDNFITPTELHYKRHHHPVPDIDAKKFRLVIAYEDANILQISLKDLEKKFKYVEKPITLQCAGNRRVDLYKVEECQGLHWEGGAVSTAVWGGVLLRDLLSFAGMGDGSALVENSGVSDVQFFGGDTPYDASIPISKALDKYGDVLVAYKMNGKPIPRDHGGPVRIIVPGHVSARSVKWLERIAVSKKESGSSWQSGYAYKGMPPNIKSFDGVDLNKYKSIQELPVQSQICLPKPGSSIDVEDEEIEVKGWAWAGGGRNIYRVDLSIDGGKTWCQADLKEGSDQPYNRAWAWTLWEATVRIPPELRKAGKEVELILRAVDSAYNQQPEHPDLVWNLRGILNNSWHRVKLSIKTEDA